MSGKKHDNFGKPGQKLRWDLVPWKQFKQVVGVLTKGGEQYGDANWQQVEHPKARYFSAAHRHLEDWITGEHADPQWGYSHLAHAIACLLFLMWFEPKFSAVDSATMLELYEPPQTPMWKSELRDALWLAHVEALDTKKVNSVKHLFTCYLE